MKHPGMEISSSVVWSKMEICNIRGMDGWTAYHFTIIHYYWYLNLSFIGRWVAGIADCGKVCASGEKQIIHIRRYGWDPSMKLRNLNKIPPWIEDQNSWTKVLFRKPFWVYHIELQCTCLHWRTRLQTSSSIDWSYEREKK